MTLEELCSCDGIWLGYLILGAALGMVFALLFERIGPKLWAKIARKI